MLAKLTFIDEKSIYKQNLASIARDCNTVVYHIIEASVGAKEKSQLSIRTFLIVLPKYRIT